MMPARPDVPSPDNSTDAEITAGDTAAAPVKRRAARRPAKPDALLAAAVDFARDSLLQVAPADQIGEHVASYPDGERLLTHRFEAFVPGYGGWEWFATLARVPRGKEPTVSEVGLLPSDRALLAPEWLPWSERVLPEDSAADEQAPAAEDAPADEQPAEEQPAGEQAARDTSAEDEPAEDEPAGDAPAEEQAAEDSLAGDAPAEEQAAGDAPAAEQTTGEEPSADEPSPVDVGVEAEAPFGDPDDAIKAHDAGDN